MTTADIHEVAKRWLQESEIQEECTIMGITRRQANNILRGRCINWKFTERIMLRISQRHSAFDRVVKMDQALQSFQK